MRKILATIALFAVILGTITQAAASNVCQDWTPFSCVNVYKTVKAKWFYGVDSVSTPKLIATTVKATYANPDSISSPLIRSRRAIIDTLNGYPQNIYQILDTALTGYATLPTDTLRLVCGANVSGYFVAGISGTSNGAALTIGHLPALCRPSHTVLFDLQKVTDNGVTRWGVGSMATTGIITVSKTDTAGVQSATFTSSGTKGVGAGVSFSYPRF